jgi:lipopolysaccharide/colanic/teichoic acid biosynthesis glycosyltransferase
VDRSTRDAHGDSYRGKRALDLVVAGTACMVFAPVVAGVALAIWLEDGGSPLFSQSRVGRWGQPFALHRFRSLRDQRITRVGQWLRTTGVDELPQLVNVCRGEMSVVGPRPLTEQDLARFGWNDRQHEWRFAARPGITGLAQLLAGGEPRASERLERFYLRRQSLSLDLQLIALSFAVNALGKRRIRRWLRATA